MFKISEIMNVPLFLNSFSHNFIVFHNMSNRARKSRTTLQNKVRLKVLPEQLTLFVNTSVTFKKMYHSIVFYYTVLIIAQKHAYFHIPVMKNIVKGLK